MSFAICGVPASVFVPGANGELPGYAGTQNHPFLRKVQPFRFDRKLLNTLTQMWVREQVRPDSAPRRGLWLSGPAGCGKTTAPEQFFARLGVPVVVQTGGRSVSVQDAVQTKTAVPSYRTNADGSKEPVGITLRPQDGNIAIAMRHGLPLIWNELDRIDPGEGASLNDIVDRGLYTVPDTGEVIEAKRGFMVIATANSDGTGDSTGRYAGVNVMDASLMRRFWKVCVDYMSHADEVEAVKTALAWRLEGATSEFIKGIDVLIAQACKAATAIRAAALTSSSDNQTLPQPISTGEVIDWVDCMLCHADIAQKGENPAIYGLDLAFTNGLPAEFRETVRTLVGTILTGNG